MGGASKSQSRNWWVGVIAQINQKKNSKNERKHKGLNKLCKKTIKIKTNKSKLKVTKSKNNFSKSKASKTNTLKKKKTNDHRKKVQSQPKAWKVGKQYRKEPIYSPPPQVVAAPSAAKPYITQKLTD